MTRLDRFIPMIIGMLCWLVVTQAWADSVQHAEFEEDKSGYPCLLKLTTDKGPIISIQLSDYDDLWSLQFFISGVPSKYSVFFDSSGLRDSDAFENAFTELKIGNRTFTINETNLWEVQRTKVDANSQGSFSIVERYNVAAAIEAMKEDGLSVVGLVDVSGTKESSTEFRACSLDAMGLADGEIVETDFRSEFRLLFEKSFKGWITSLETADSCLQARFDTDDVDEVITNASDAFYPGILNIFERSAYREKLTSKLALYKLEGSVDALKGSCMLSGEIAEMSRRAVDQAIEAANGLD